MTQADMDELLEACKPVACMMIGGYAPSSPQENANRAWKRLGAKMGFDGDTVEPRAGFGALHFTAVPSETREAAMERKNREIQQKQKEEYDRLDSLS